MFVFNGEMIILSHTVYPEKSITPFDELTGTVTGQWNAGNHIELHKWIFEKANSLKCNEIITILNQNKVNFSLFHKPSWRNVVIYILKSNVELMFEKENDLLNEDANLFCFKAFSLSSKSVSNLSRE